MRGRMNAHTGRKGSPERPLGRKCTASCRTPFHLPELAEGIPGKGQALTSEGTQLAHPPRRPLDGTEVGARSTKSLPGKADWGSILLIHTMRIFLETRPASRVFSSLHGLRLPYRDNAILKERPQVFQTIPDIPPHLQELRRLPQIAALPQRLNREAYHGGGFFLSQQVLFNSHTALQCFSRKAIKKRPTLS